MANVYVNYDNFSKDHQSIKSVMFELLPNTQLTLERDESNVNLTLTDNETDSVSLTGALDEEILNNLIKSLCLIRNQINNS